MPEGWLAADELVGALRVGCFGASTGAAAALIAAAERPRRVAAVMSRGDFVDDVILAAAAETEHHEIAVYEELITYAEAMGRQDVAAPMRQNLAQEQHTLGEIRSAAERIAEETLQPA